MPSITEIAFATWTSVAVRTAGRLKVWVKLSGCGASADMSGAVFSQYGSDLQLTNTIKQACIQARKKEGYDIYVLFTHTQPRYSSPWERASDLPEKEKMDIHAKSTWDGHKPMRKTLSPHGLFIPNLLMYGLAWLG